MGCPYICAYSADSWCQDGAKLSKRHGALGVDAYRDEGYLPEALNNYLMRLGWSHGDEEFSQLNKLFTGLIWQRLVNHHLVLILISCARLITIICDKHQRINWQILFRPII